MRLFVSLATLAFAASAAVAQGLTINTPINVVVCQPVLITWTGGQSPYFLSILPGSQPSASPLINFGQVSGTSLTWTANITAGTSIGLTIRDSTGLIAQSAPFTIMSGNDMSCLSGSAASGAPTASNTSPAASGATQTSPSTASATSTPTTTGSASFATTNTATPPSSSNPSATTTSTSNAGTTQAVNLGAAALFGAAAVALLA